MKKTKRIQVSPGKIRKKMNFFKKILSEKTMDAGYYCKTSSESEETLVEIIEESDVEDKSPLPPYVYGISRDDIAKNNRVEMTSSSDTESTSSSDETPWITKLETGPCKKKCAECQQDMSNSVLTVSKRQPNALILSKRKNHSYESLSETEHFANSNFKCNLVRKEIPKFIPLQNGFMYNRQIYMPMCKREETTQQDIYDLSRVYKEHVDVKKHWLAESLSKQVLIINPNVVNERRNRKQRRRGTKKHGEHRRNGTIQNAVTLGQTTKTENQERLIDINSSSIIPPGRCEPLAQKSSARIKTVYKPKKMQTTFTPKENSRIIRARNKRKRRSIKKQNYHKDSINKSHLNGGDSFNDKEGVNKQNNNVVKQASVNKVNDKFNGGIVCSECLKCPTSTPQFCNSVFPFDQHYIYWMKAVNSALQSQTMSFPNLNFTNCLHKPLGEPTVSTQSLKDCSCEACNKVESQSDTEKDQKNHGECLFNKSVGKDDESLKISNKEKQIATNINNSYLEMMKLFNNYFNNAYNELNLHSSQCDCTRCIASRGKNNLNNCNLQTDFNDFNQPGCSTWSNSNGCDPLQGLPRSSNVDNRRDQTYKNNTPFSCINANADVKADSKRVRRRKKKYKVSSKCSYLPLIAKNTGTPSDRIQLRTTTDAHALNNLTGVDLPNSMQNCKGTLLPINESYFYYNPEYRKYLNTGFAQYYAGSQPDSNSLSDKCTIFKHKHFPVDFAYKANRRFFLPKMLRKFSKKSKNCNCTRSRGKPSRFIYLEQKEPMMAVTVDQLSQMISGFKPELEFQPPQMTDPADKNKFRPEDSSGFWKTHHNNLSE